MNRGMLALVSLVACAALSVGAGCGDSTGSGGSGAGGGTGGTPAEGGGGNGTTGATCADYCATMTTACSGANSQYASEDGCLAECAAFEQGDAGAMSGNSLECRAYHASVAATPTDPQIHCVHAGPLGGGADAMVGCGDDPCESFCNIATEICTGVDGYPFTSFDDCHTQCQGYTDDVDFTTNETTGDSLACRMYHLSVAAQSETEAATHCAHVSGSMCAPL